MLGKRGQITIFIILGVLIVLGAITFFWLREEIALPIEPDPEIDEFPQAFKSVQTYVEGCIEQLGDEAALKIVQHGGYIEPNNDLFSGEFSFNALFPTDSTFVSLTGNPESSIPYWLFQREPNPCESCLLDSARPSIDEMALQISLYISREFGSCFASYAEQIEQQVIDIKPLALIPYIETVIGDGFISMSMKYPMLLQKEGTEIQVEQFYKKINFPLKELYDYAMIITLKELETQFLETYSLFVLDKYQSLDAEKFPPFYSATEGYDIIIWIRYLLQQKFQQLLSIYTPLMQVDGTANFKEISSPLTLEDTFFRMMQLDIFEGDEHDDLEISFYYNNQPMFFEVVSTDSTAEIIMPERIEREGSMIVPPRQLNRYEFFYNYAFPVIVELRKKQAYKDQDISFLFALEANVKHNKRIMETMAGLTNLYGSDIEFSLVADEQSGIDLQTGEPIQQQIHPPVRTMFCNPNQQLSGTISFDVYDAVTLLPVEDAGVSFACGGYAKCSIGTTQYNADERMFNQPLPLCIGGTLTIDKQGYMPESIPLDTALDESKIIPTIIMYPEKTVNISIKRFFMNDFTNALFINETTDLDQDEIALVTFKEISGNSDYFSVIVYDNTTNETLQATLVPGVYDIDAMYFDAKGVVIPKKSKKICSGVSCLPIPKSKRKIPPNSIPLKPAPWGGVQWKSYQINANQLYSADNINVSIFRFPDPQNIDDLEYLNKLKEYTTRFRSELQLEFN